MNVKKVLGFSIGPIGGAVLGLITLPIIAWFFSPSDIGRLTMLQASISFSLMFFTLGLDQAYVREFHEVKDKAELFKSTLLPGFLLLVIALMALTILPWSISELLFGDDSLLLTLILFVSVLLAFLSRFLSLILRMQERGVAFSMSQVLPKLFFLMVVGVYIWWGAESSFKNLMLANFISLIFVFVIFAWNTRQQWVLSVTSSIDFEKQKYMIRYALPLIASGLAFWGLTTMDRFFLRSLSSFDELGVYSLAVSFAGAALVFQAIFSTVWVPTVYKWVSDGVDTEKIKRVNEYTLLFVMIIWAIAGMFSWILNLILPPKYEQVQYILLAVMAYPLLYTLSEATGIGISIKRKTLYSMIAALLALSVNAFGNWFLIPVYGAAGAAMASAIAFFVFFVVRTEISTRVFMDFSRTGMYVLILIGLALSLSVNVDALLTPVIPYVYFVLFVLVLFVYKRHVSQLVTIMLAKYVR